MVYKKTQSKVEGQRSTVESQKSKADNEEQGTRNQEPGFKPLDSGSGAGMTTKSKSVGRFWFYPRTFQRFRHCRPALNRAAPVETVWLVCNTSIECGMTRQSSIPPFVIVVLDTTIQHLKKGFNLIESSTSTPIPLDSGSEAGMTRSLEVLVWPFSCFNFCFSIVSF